MLFDLGIALKQHFRMCPMYAHKTIAAAFVKKPEEVPRLLSKLTYCRGLNNYQPNVEAYSKQVPYTIILEGT